MADKKPSKATKPAAKAAKSSPKSLAELQAELRDARISHASGELVNPRRLGELRREIARVKTAMNTEKGVN